MLLWNGLDESRLAILETYWTRTLKPSGHVDYNIIEEIVLNDFLLDPRCAKYIIVVLVVISRKRHVLKRLYNRTDTTLLPHCVYCT